MDPSHPYIEFHETVVSHNTVHCVCSVGPKTLARQDAKGVTAKAVRTISINNQVSALYNKALGISQGLNYQHMWLFHAAIEAKTFSRLAPTPHIKHWQIDKKVCSYSN
jgi:hypothetical protein